MIYQLLKTGFVAWRLAGLGAQITAQCKVLYTAYRGRFELGVQAVQTYLRHIWSLGSQRKEHVWGSPCICITNLNEP